MVTIQTDLEYQFVKTRGFFTVHIVFFIGAFISFAVIRRMFNDYKKLVRENKYNTKDVIDTLLVLTDTKYKTILKVGYGFSIMLLILILINIGILYLQYKTTNNIYYFNNFNTPFLFYRYELLLFFNFWGIIFTSLGINTMQKLDEYRNELIKEKSRTAKTKEKYLKRFDKVIGPIFGIGVISFIFVVFVLLYIWSKDFHKYFPKPTVI